LANLLLLFSPWYRREETQMEAMAHKNSSGDLIYTVLIEGNVGSGKSTLLDVVREERPDVLVVPEPVAAWQNVNGTDLLEEVRS